MLNNKNTILLNLKRLGLKPDEAKVYLCLLDEPMSHLEIARRTGINRTKVYRLAGELEKRGLIADGMRAEGHELAAADPTNLEITITTAEEKLRAQQAIYEQTLPTLKSMFAEGHLPKDEDFIVNTYEGIDGFKQMLWNELKAKDEMLALGSGRIDDLIDNFNWGERYRQKAIEAGYTIRELLNPGDWVEIFTNNKEYVSDVYDKRFISPEIVRLRQQICIYNNTVAIYNWRDGQKVGTEIINKDFADMQRAIFEHYWKLAK